MTSTIVPPPAAPPAQPAIERTPLARHPALWLTLGAIVLRLIVFTSRGDYVAFDEGWYLLLGRSLFDGDGYTLSGLRHTTLSPLFPVLAGAMGTLLGDIIWGGRLVAALAAGLLIVPCWHLFHRLAGRQAALIGCLLVAVMPSLAPFAAPYWIEWDLWVGAEPLLHLFAFGGLALTLRALDRGRVLDYALAGASFALAYLARPEAILVFGLVGGAVGIMALAGRNAPRIARALVMALAFAATAAPYWLYLHDALGRWAISGRMVDLPAPRARADSTGAAAGAPRASSGIERMLWQDDNTPYVRVLYGLDASGTRLGSTYWGIPAELSDSAAADLEQRAAARAAAAAATPPADSAARVTYGRPPGRWELYARSLGTVVPWFLLPFIVLGLPGRRRALHSELLVVMPLVVTSIAVARLVGADPRTQLLIVPIAAFYAARGICRLGDVADLRAAGAGLRRGFVSALATAVLALVLVTTIGRWSVLGWTMGSPHHTVGAANRAAGAALAGIAPPTESVMSWHPAIALFADRDWRVLPYAPLHDIVGYANAIECEYILLSAFHPGSQLIRDLPRDHLVLHVPPGVASLDGWRVELSEGSDSHMVGRLVNPAAPQGVPR
jgi:4-amino-4-deoxy-L-arabinose transferase-like glycosyltransferase